MLNVRMSSFSYLYVRQARHNARNVVQKYYLFPMPGNKAFPKAALAIALSCLCGLMTAQNVSKLDSWEGDTSGFNIDSKTVKCTTDDEVTIHAVQDASRGCTWETAVTIPDGKAASIALFPMADDIDRLDDSEHFIIKRNEAMRYVEARNIDGYDDAYSIISLLGPDTQPFTLAITLTADGRWEVEVNGTRIFDENTLTSRSGTSQLFAMRFTGMDGATVSNVTLTTDGGEQPPVDPDDGDDDGDDDDGGDDDDDKDLDDGSHGNGSSGLAYGDIVVTEVMANPVGAARLPEAEYVELLNTTDSTLDLSGWAMRYGSTTYPIEGGQIAPGGYLILSKAVHAAAWDSLGVGQRVDMERFPTIANAGNTIFIYDADGTIVAYTHYTDARYGDAFKAECGFSLERIDVGNINDTPANWAASRDLSGGTPAAPNSVAGSCDAMELSSFAYVEMVAADTFNLHFTVPLDLMSAVGGEWLDITGGDRSVAELIPDTLTLTTVGLVLDGCLDADECVLLSIDGLMQIDGEMAIAPDTVLISLPREAGEGDIVFNEILFDAADGQCEFVEVVNISPHSLDASTLSVVTLDDEGRPSRSCRLSGTRRIIAPGDYLALTTDTATLGRLWGCLPWQGCLCGLPSLRNEGGTVALCDASAQTIDLAVYSPKSYPSTALPARGISLEKINPALPSSNPANWLPATSECGCATPGKVNSQHVGLGNPSRQGTFELQGDFFTPDGDGDNDAAIISYSLAAGGWTANVTVHDSNGREVARPVQRQTLSQSGTLVWNGTDDDGDTLGPGIYVIVIEAFDERGDMVKKKLAVAIN